MTSEAELLSTNRLKVRGMVRSDGRARAQEPVRAGAGQRDEANNENNQEVA